MRFPVGTLFSNRLTDERHGFRLLVSVDVINQRANVFSQSRVGWTFQSFTVKAIDCLLYDTWSVIA